MKHFLTFCALSFSVCANVHADTASPDNDKDFSLMGALADNDWHDFNDERWNLYSQATYITNYKDGFHAAYSNLNGTPNSLSAHAERSFTATYTGFLGFKAWEGSEFYYVPEMIASRPLSGLKGLGGSVQNFELQKTGAPHATWYRSRAFMRQTLSFGGKQTEVPSAPMQLAGHQDSRRFVVTFGNLSVLDIFDKNSYTSDTRQQFLNIAFMTHAAYDFAADARGYSWGLAGELYFDDWALRFGRFLAPKNPNDLPLDYRPFTFYGDQLEIEHKHRINTRAGSVKLLAFRNHENQGRWTDAIAAYQSNHALNATTCHSFNYGSANAAAPDLCWSRQPNNKVGIGLNIEQQFTSDIGVFARGLYADGKTEVYSYTSSDRSASVGGLIKGLRWGRERDVLGIGYAQSWISKQHADYLNLGGIDGFIGDGRIRSKPERLLDIFYNWHVYRSLWLSVDYQYLENPAYNADRGPVEIYGGRVHVEF